MLYILYGSEPYLIDKEKNNILQGDSYISISTYDMREIPVQIALEEARTISLFGDTKAVILKDAYFLTGETGKVQHDIDDLLKYIASPSETTKLLLITQSEKLDKRKKVVKELLKTAKVVYEAKPLRHIEGWIQEQFQQRGKNITTEAIQFMVQQLGKNLYLLEHEIEKICLNLSHELDIKQSMIEPLLARTLESDVFKLIDRVARKDRSALSLLEDLFSLGEDPIKILLLIARQYRMMLQIKLLREKGQSLEKIAGIIKVHPYAAKIANEQSQCFTKEELFSLLCECSELDHIMKTGRMDKHLALETTISKWV